MPKYTIIATQTKTYQVEVEAADPEAAIASLDDWIEDDYQDHITWSEWRMETI